MSNASEAASMEDGDESILFNDGFSVVDDINTPLGNVKVEESSKETEKKPKANGKQPSDSVADTRDNNTKEIVSDKKVKSEDVIEQVKSENPTTTSENKPESNLSKTPSNSSLMITNDVDSGSDSNSTRVDKNASVDKQPEAAVEVKDDQSSIVKKAAALRKKNESSFVWVSNITKQIKASTLKKHFAECGKVSTAKVVTNGKVFFGYVEFEVADHATACIKTMNNTVLEGRKILVTRNRPDVTKKPIVTPKKIDKKEDQPVKIETNTKTQKKPEPEKVEKVEPPKNTEDKKNEEKPKPDTKESKEKKKDKDAKSPTEDKKTPTPTVDSKKSDVKKDRPKRSKSAERSKKIENELRRKLNDNLKRISRLRADLDRSNIEANNLRRRLTNEQRRTKAEELRGEKYKTEARTLSDQLKQTRADYEKETQLLIKKHKMELEKATYQREGYLRKEEELKRRQDELKLRQDDFEKEFKRLEEAKRSLEHLKRSRKSRSSSPPLKRYRGRDDGYPERKITPPPPKLSVDIRSKNPTERIPPYYDEKKPKGIYNRLGDYGEKEHYAKESNGRHRSGYAGDVDVPKSSWTQSSSPSDWKKTSSGSMDWKKPASSSSDWKTPSSSPLDWKKPSGSSDWKKPSSGSSDWKKPSGGSSDWKKPSAGSSDWKTPSSLDWKKPSAGSSEWKTSSSGSLDWKAPSSSSMDWKKPGGGSPDWKKPNSSNPIPKGYLDRFGSTPTEYQMPSPFFSSGPAYFKHSPFENSRKH